MKIKDKIYGIEDVRECALVDLINSRPVQRLKGIAQLGIPDEYYFKKGFSRYEHSIGVFILLRKLNAGLEEQVAGLLHDVSHTAFSHVVDLVVGDPTKEDYQDKNHKEFIKNSSVKNILEKYNFDYKKISKLENFSLLEKPAPGLCADRIDYALREMHNNKGKKRSVEIFNNLIVKENQIVFKTKKTAEIFAKEYMLLQKESWGGDQARTRYYLFSEILKKGLEKKLICQDDFKKTDSYVLERLENSKEEFILQNLNILKKGFEAVDCERGIELKKKFRYIDPEISVNGSYKKLSGISKDYAKFLGIEKEKSKIIKKIKIIPK